MPSILSTYKNHLGVVHGLSSQLLDAYQRTFILAEDSAAAILGGGDIDWASQKNFQTLSAQLNAYCWQVKAGSQFDESSIQLFDPKSGNHANYAVAVASQLGMTVAPNIAAGNPVLEHASFGTAEVQHLRTATPAETVLEQVITSLRGADDPAIGQFVSRWWGKLGKFSVSEKTYLSVGQLVMVGDSVEFTIKCSSIGVAFSTGSGCHPVPSGSVGYGSQGVTFTLNQTEYGQRQAQIARESAAQIAHGIATAPL